MYLSMLKIVFAWMVKLRPTIYGGNYEWYANTNTDTNTNTNPMQIQIKTGQIIPVDAALWSVLSKLKTCICPLWLTRIWILIQIRTQIQFRCKSDKFQWRQLFDLCDLLWRSSSAQTLQSDSNRQTLDSTWQPPAHCLLGSISFTEL